MRTYLIPIGICLCLALSILAWKYFPPGSEASKMGAFATCFSAIALASYGIDILTKSAKARKYLLQLFLVIAICSETISMLELYRMMPEADRLDRLGDLFTFLCYASIASLAVTWLCQILLFSGSKKGLDTFSLVGLYATMASTACLGWIIVAGHIADLHIHVAIPVSFICASFVAIDFYRNAYPLKHPAIGLLLAITSPFYILLPACAFFIVAGVGSMDGGALAFLFCVVILLTMFCFRPTRPAAAMIVAGGFRIVFSLLITVLGVFAGSIAAQTHKDLWK